jgi:uncharacterized membrane protein
MEGSIWEPIAKKMTFEAFDGVPKKDEPSTIVGNVFTGVGLMIAATVLTIGFYMAYQREKLLFIAILCVVVFLYSIKVVILVAALRAKMNPMVFRIYMGSTVFMALMSMILMILFSIKASQRMRGSFRSSQPPATYPSSPTDYS